MKEEENASKEALNGTTLAQSLFGPDWWQAGTVLLAVGIPRNDRNRTQDCVNPSDEAQPLKSINFLGKSHL
jgi:hypothetical protein